MAERNGNYVDLFKKYDQCADCPLAQRATNGVYRQTDGQRHIPHIIGCSPHKMGPFGIFPARQLRFIFHRPNLALTPNGKVRGIAYNLSTAGKCPGEKGSKNQTAPVLIDKDGY